MYIWTKYAEDFSKELGIKEERKSGTVATFAGEPLTGGNIANRWKKAGYVTESEVYSNDTRTEQTA